MPETQKVAGSSAVVEQAAESSILDQIVETGRFSDPSARERGKGLIKEFVAQVLEGSMTLGRDADQMISARVAQIDHLISLQLNEVIAPPAVPEAGRNVARAEVPARPVRNRDATEDSRT